MKTYMSGARWMVVVIGLVAGCAAEGDDAVDGISDSFTDGKADGFGFAEGSAEACMILRAANDATLAELDDDAGLDGRAAAAIVAARPFTTLAALDAAPFVGAIAADKLLGYAADRGWTCDDGGQPECTATGGSYDAVSFTRDEECHAVDFMNRGRLSDMGPLSARLRGVVYDTCPQASRPCLPGRAGRWHSVRELADLPAIATTSIKQLKAAAAAWTPSALPYDTVADVWARRAELDNHPIGLERVYVTDRRRQVTTSTGWPTECVQVKDDKAAANFLEVCVRHNPSDSGTSCTGDAVKCVDDMVGRWMHLDGVLHGSRLSLADGGGSAASPYLPVVGEDPACTASWCTMPQAPAPFGWMSFASAWTGKELVVWGGAGWTASRGDGRRFDPMSNTWRPMSLVGAPTGRDGAAGAWTGSEVLVWGGMHADSGVYQNLDDGGRYDPVTDSWQAMSTTGAPSKRQGAMTAWTGKELLVWGGRESAVGPVASGARYLPVTDSWKSMNRTGAPSPRENAVAVWTGKRFIVWGGSVPDGAGVERFLADGRAYDPLTNKWSAIATAGAPSARRSPAAVWTGTELLVWGGFRVKPDGFVEWLRDGHAYRPASDTWRALPTVPAGIDAAEGASAVWTGTEAVIFGGTSGSFGERGLSPGLAYAPASNTWRSLPRDYRPGSKIGAAVVWTGDELLVWGGTCRSCGLGAARLRLP